MSDKQPSKQPLGVLAAATVLLCGAGLLFIFIASPPPGAPTLFSERPTLVPLQKLAAKPSEAAPPPEVREESDVPGLEVGEPTPALLPGVAVDPTITGTLPSPPVRPAPLPRLDPEKAAALQALRPEAALAAKPLPAPTVLLQVAAAEAAVEAPIADRTGEPLLSPALPEIPVKTRTLAEEPVAGTVAARITEPPHDKERGETAAGVKRSAKPMTVGRATTPDRAAKREAERAPSPKAGSAPATRTAKGYSGRVYSAIARHRRRIRGLSGSATVTFAIGPAGGLQMARVTRSSGKPPLDRAALATVRNAAPFPAPPPGAKASYSIQIYFR